MKDGYMFLTYPDNVTGRTLIIEDDDNTVWAYITKPNSQQIDFDGWICNKIPAPCREDIERYHGTPPPAPREVLEDSASFFSNIEEHRILAKWLGGKCANIYIDGVHTVSLFPDTRESFNKALTEDCGWGKRFTP